MTALRQAVGDSASKKSLFQVIIQHLCPVNDPNQPRVFFRRLDFFVYARHGHELMGWKSPIIEPLYVLFKCTAIISERQLQSREALLRGSL